MALEPLAPLPLHLATPADFTAAYGQLFVLLDDRPLNAPRLQALWAAMDDYVTRCPCPTWPLATVAADGTRNSITSLSQLLLLRGSSSKRADLHAKLLGRRDGGAGGGVAGPSEPGW